jgi:hypothetical protein
VALGELLGADQLVLQLAAVAARERVPAIAAVERPLLEGPTPPFRLAPELAGEQLIALHVDHHHAEPRLDVAGDAPQQRVRLAGSGRAHEQPVASRMAAEAQRHGPVAAVEPHQVVPLIDGSGVASAAGGESVANSDRLTGATAGVAAGLTIPPLKQEDPARGQEAADRQAGRPTLHGAKSGAHADPYYGRQ